LPRYDTYRRDGAECLRLAANAVEPGDKAILLALAEGWRLLAERAEAEEGADPEGVRSVPEAGASDAIPDPVSGRHARKIRPAAEFSPRMRQEDTHVTKGSL
jgi:hypothetical protein